MKKYYIIFSLFFFCFSFSARADELFVATPILPSNYLTENLNPSHPSWYCFSFWKDPTNSPPDQFVCNTHIISFSEAMELDTWGEIETYLGSFPYTSAVAESYQSGPFDYCKVGTYYQCRDSDPEFRRGNLITFQQTAGTPERTATGTLTQLADDTINSVLGITTFSINEFFIWFLVFSISYAIIVFFNKWVRSIGMNKGKSENNENEE